MEQVFQALGIVLVATLESQKMVQLCVPLGKVTPLIHWSGAICSHSSTKVNTCACVVAVHINITIIIICSSTMMYYLYMFIHLSFIHIERGVA